jgi:hypothetical protein
MTGAASVATTCHSIVIQFAPPLPDDIPMTDELIADPLSRLCDGDERHARNMLRGLSHGLPPALGYPTERRHSG